MNNRSTSRSAFAFVCSVVVAAAAFAGLAAWGFSQLDSTEQQIVVTSGMTTDSLYISTTQTGDHHEHP